MSGKMNNTEDWQCYTTICRLCMQRDGFMLGIFNHIQGKEKSIYKKIMDCTALEISSGDGLPNSICHRCLFKIEFCLEFRQQCFVSDATLRQINGLVKDAPTAAMQLPTMPDQSDNNVVMVVDPNAMDYESEYDTDANVENTNDHANSDVETIEPNDTYEYKNVFMCKYCDKAFVNKTDCARHETDDHDGDEPYKCSVCVKYFADRILYSSHLKNAHQNDKPFTCPECYRSFARRSDLRKHTIVHTGIKPYTCPICFKSFSRNTNLSKHIRLHKGQKPFVCHSCPRTFMSKLELTKHAVQHSGAKPFKCDYCSMGFMRKDKLLRHQKRHLPQENSKDTAQELQAMRENLMQEYGMNDFATAQDSNDNHIEVTGVKKEEQKDDWPSTESMVINIDPFNNDGEADQVESFSVEPDISVNNGTDSDATNATSPDKSKENLPSVPDHILGYSFSNADHQDGDSPGSQRIPCPMCSQKFATQERLDNHMGLHTGDRPFACYVCGKAFMRKRELDRHSATHTGIKQFECSRCEKRFSRKDKLLRHTRIHDAQKEPHVVGDNEANEDLNSNTKDDEITATT